MLKGKYEKAPEPIAGYLHALIKLFDAAVPEPSSWAICRSSFGYWTLERFKVERPDSREATNMGVSIWTLSGEEIALVASICPTRGPLDQATVYEQWKREHFTIDKEHVIMKVLVPDQAWTVK